MKSEIRKLEDSNCKSCQFKLVTRSPFCPSCGGRVIRERLTIKSVFHEFYQNVFNINNKFFSTIRDLTICPEKVFVAYISGARKRYYNPVSLIAIAIVLSTISYSFLFEKMDSIDNSEIQEYAYNLGLKGAGASEEEIQKRLEDEEFKEKFEKSKQESLEVQEEYNNFIKNNLGLVAYLNIPIYAIIAFLVFLNKKLYNFAEMVSIVLYQNAYTTLIGFLLNLIFYLLGINIYILSVLTFLIIFIYSNYSFQRLFKLSVSQLIIANLKFFLVSFILFIILIILVVATMVFSQFIL